MSVLCWLVIRTDERSWRAAEFDEPTRHAAVSTSLICYTDRGIQLDGLHDDEATRGGHRLAVLVRPTRTDGAVSRRPDGRLDEVFVSGARTIAVVDASIAALARTVMDNDSTLRGKLPAGTATAYAVAALLPR
ncbi:hypothetical protein [Streptomyces cyaneofuscatus]|uniref:hypothetical protein n=1 Tax=Streptomyces cyaneofuscatus TaxID=66883 RepID=UPI0036516544